MRIDEKGSVAHSRIAVDELGVPAAAECVLKKLRAPYHAGADEGCVSVRLRLRFVGDAGLPRRRRY